MEWKLSPETDAHYARLPGRAGALFRAVEKLWRDSYRGKKEDFEIDLLVGTPFGVNRVVHLYVVDADTLSLNLDGNAKDYQMLYLPVEQCAFMLRHYKPEAPGDKERVVVGFGEPPTEKVE